MAPSDSYSLALFCRTTDTVPSQFGQIHGQLTGQIITGHTTDTISSEKPAHETCPRIPCLVTEGFASRFARRSGQRFEYCDAFLAFLSPYFLRSFTRGSRVRNPALFRVGLFSGSTRIRARAIPSRSAPACPVTPPPVIRATTSNWLSAPRLTKGSLMSCW